MEMRVKVGSLLNGVMAYWDKIEEAARYYIKLYVEETSSYSEKLIHTQELETVEIDRNKLYHTFQGLAKYYEQGTTFDYFIEVFAENREGVIVAQSQKVKVVINDSLCVYDNSNCVF